MLFKGNMRPAYATAGSNGFASNDRSKVNGSAMFSEGHSASDDFGSFNGGASSAPKKSTQRTAPPPRRPKKNPINFNFNLDFFRDNMKTVIIVAAVALAALVILIVAGVLIFAGPKNGIPLDDNAYFVYTDNDGRSYVVSNGKVLKQEFTGEVSIEVSSDNSFAYVFEEVNDENGSGIKMYILNGSKLKSIESKADEIIALADYEPGIIYKKNSRFHYFSAKDNSPITSDPSADDFIISGDGETVVYTVDSSKEPGRSELKYFCDGGSQTVGPYDFVPVKLSTEGEYVYGISEANGTLHYLEIKKDGEEWERFAITSSKNGYFGDITGMNQDGDEIIFYTLTEKGTVSYIYKIEKEAAPVQIAEGIFTPVYSNNGIICPKSFLGTYFTCKKDLLNSEGISVPVTMTYLLDKTDGARKIADTTGQFCPEGKYFYYIDEDNNLLRVALNSNDFEEDAKSVMNDVTDFAVIEKGDVYAMLPDGDFGMIYFWDASTAKRTVITHDATPDSMELSANSIYFSENIADEITIYVSTSGSTKKEASFNQSALSGTPTISMGVGEKGYAYFTDENGTTKLYYTSNGEKFSLVASGCVIDGLGNGGVVTEKPTEAPEEEEE